MGIYNMLFPYQKNIVDQFKSKDKYGLFLDMGLGKTPTSLAFTEVNNCTKLLIVTINSKATEKITDRGSWLNWADKSDIKYNFYDKKYLKSKDIITADTNDCLILNYEALYERKSENKKQRVTLKEKIVEFINSCKGHNVGIILDESHKVKDLQSLQTGAIIKIKNNLELVSKKCYTYLLTGTPFTTGYEDLYTQLKLLGWDGTKGEFYDRFCVRDSIPSLLPWQQPVKSYKNIDELYKLIHKYAITIKSEDVLDLPNKIIIDHISNETSAFLFESREKLRGHEIDKLLQTRGILDIDEKRYNTKSYVNNPFYRNLAYPSEKWLAEETGVFWMRCRQASIGFQGNVEEAAWYDRSRLAQLEKFLSENEDNYLLFYNYMPELIEIYDICEKLGYNIDVYAGDAKLKSLVFYNKYASQTPAERLTNHKNIILANFVSGSTGMNWQEYNKCIIFSLPLFKDWEQGLKRIHRYGQKDTCFYHIFYQDNWLDRGMKKALEESIDYNNDMFADDLKRVNEIMGK